MPCPCLPGVWRWVVALGLLLSSLTCAPPVRRHSVVLVTFDTTRADRIGAYGGPAGLTPTWDAAAAAGVVFQWAQSHAAVTPVAHASLFTGLNAYDHGLRTLHGNRLFSLAAGVTTLAQRFQGLGYQTAAFISAFPCSRRFGLDRGFDHFDEDFAGKTARLGRAGNVSTGLAQRGAAATTDAALQWLGERQQNQPYFLWVHYFDPHDPLLRPPADETAPYMVGLDQYADMEKLLATDMGGFVNTYAGRVELMKDWLLRLYDAEVAHADRQLGRLLEAVNGTPGGEPVVTALTSDHGEGLGDHGWWGHGILYQEQVRVPLILTGPGLPAGLVIQDRVRHVDVAPTLLDLAAGSSFLQPVEGISLDPLMQSRSQAREPLASMLPGPAYADSVAIMRYGAVFSLGVAEEKDDQLYTWIDGDLKWIRHRLSPAASELYDLAVDPGERNNLIRSRGADAARLDAALETRTPMTQEVDFSLPEDTDVRERLRSLGYVD